MSKSEKKLTDLILSPVFILVTCALLISFFYTRYPLIKEAYTEGKWILLAEIIVFLFIVLSLAYGILVYYFSRYGYYSRLYKFKPRNKGVVERYFYASGKSGPRLTALIPSYKEELKTIEQTIMSVALQHYPRKSIVLLIDNPPNPKSKEDKELLKNTRKLKDKVCEQTAKIRHKIKATLNTLLQNDCRQNTKVILFLYREILEWYEGYEKKYSIQNHTDKWFVEKIIKSPQKHYRLRINDLRKLLDEGQALSKNQIAIETQKLRTLFEFKIDNFERKAFENLSHAPNKAMNINSYISLMGNSYDLANNGKRLVKNKNGAMKFPDSDYLLTLDADSLLLNEYAQKLICELQQEENRKVAVIQTPYSAIPGAPNEIEEAAGATTDIQYIMHQGFHNYKATYWVGANAIIRKEALKDIEESFIENGHKLTRYVQDKTVIEDTESTIDLLTKGWTCFNYPERLSYSATPPDFGSLIIQRRRWANGGLLILPKALAHLKRHFLKPCYLLSAGPLRVHYLISITLVNFSILTLLFYSFSDRLFTLRVISIGFIYFYAYYRDLLKIGYDRSMVFKVYALNLLLIPVNIAGVLKSIQQGITGGKIPFGRTPKVNDRTRSERKYIFFEYLILLGIIASAAHSSYKHEWLYFCFSLFNLISMLYAIKLIGFKESLEDLFRTPNQDIPQGNLVSSQNAVCSLVNLKNRSGSDGA